MAQLKVKLRGKVVADISLASEKTYIAGRREDVDIVLKPEKGISREHFQLAFEGGVWRLSLTSKYGDVMANGEKIQELNLQHGQVFAVSTYEFEFLDTPEVVPDPFAAVAMNDELSMSTPGEKTMVTSAPSMPYVKVVDKDGEAKEIFRLDGGDSWVAGRDANCHVQIRDQRVSRRQFEIRQINNQYYILDLESVNGTLLNGSPISSTEPQLIRSGDSISVLNNHLFFELHDPHFQSRMELVNLQPLNSLSTASYESDLVPYEPSGPVAPYQMPSAPAPMPMPVSKKFDFQKNRKFIFAGAIVLLALVYVLKPDDKPKPVVIITQDPFSKLKPEQQAAVKQSYQLAKNLYMQGKYELAQNEIAKLQEIIADYEDIKEIQKLAVAAIEIQEQKRRQEQIEKARAETEEKITKQSIICNKKINPSITMEQMDECLAPVLEFNPEHPRILQLRAQVETLINQRLAQEAQRAAYQDQVAKLKGIYARAAKIEKDGKNLDAIEAYQGVANSKLPDPQGLKKQANQNITNIRKMMNSKTAALQADAEKAHQAGNLKAAILALRKARQVDPENLELQDRIDRYVSDLKKQMMVYYQEGILEESFGNVEGGEGKSGAREKWKMIINLDVPDGEYYKKAYIKLKKYGAL